MNLIVVVLVVLSSLIATPAYAHRQTADEWLGEVPRKTMMKVNFGLGMNRNLWGTTPIDCTAFYIRGQFELVFGPTRAVSTGVTLEYSLNSSRHAEQTYSLASYGVFLAIDFHPGLVVSPKLWLNPIKRVDYWADNQLQDGAMYFAVGWTVNIWKVIDAGVEVNIDYTFRRPMVPLYFTLSFPIKGF